MNKNSNAIATLHHAGYDDKVKEGARENKRSKKKTVPNEGETTIREEKNDQPSQKHILARTHTYTTVVLY